MASNNGSKQKKVVLPLSDEMGKWIEDHAAENDISGTEVLRRALAEYRNAKSQVA